MVAFLAIFLAGVCGYFEATALTWPVAAAGLLSASLANHYQILRHALERGYRDIAYDTLARSAANAIIAIGLSYWLGRFARILSGL